MSDIDAVDLRLLSALLEDGRAPVVQLARTAGVSRATAYQRLTRLERIGAVRGYAARVDPQLLGLELTAVILVSGGQKSSKPLKVLLESMPQVERAWYVTGGADVLLVVRVRNVAELRALVIERLHTIPDLRNTQTLLTLEQVIDRPYVLPT